MSIQDKLSRLPTSPGVYLMKDEQGKIIYVGKAVNLRNRVRSYFQSSRNHSPKTIVLVEQIRDFEYIVTDSEVEALILENNLIKEHAPWYNIRLKDDKTYPYIKVTMNEEFPRVLLVRRRLSDGAKYYGPYTSTSAVRSTLKTLRRLFPIRSCNKDIKEGMNDRPCLNYHIGRCLAPCAGLVDKESYQQTIAEACLFLEGRHDSLIPDLRKKMQQASKELDFEKAARLRDRIQALEQVVEKQKIVAANNVEQDVIGYARLGNAACLQVFFVRGGKIIGREHFMMNCNIDEEQAEIIAAFIKQYYHDQNVIAKEILTAAVPDEAELLEQWLSKLRGSRVYLRTPQRGSKRALMEMVSHNAQLILDDLLAQEERKIKAIERGLWELQHALGLEDKPNRIEAFDISNIQGNQVVASMVVLLEGKANNDQYRRFKIQSVEGKPNDYMAMQEVVRRRFTRGLKEQVGEIIGDKFSSFPDLVLIDGGKGQLNAALAVRDELGLTIPFIGLAERLEEIYLESQSEPLILPRESQGLYMVQRVRDEAHRFAVSYHRQLRSKANQGSILDDIPGVGAVRKRALVKHFGSVKSIKEATVEQLLEVDGVNHKVAKAIYQYVRK